jgi:LysM repeat protein
MSRSRTKVPPAHGRSVAAVAAAVVRNDSPKLARRLVFGLVVASMLSVLSPTIYTAEADAAGTTAVRATQNSVAAWSCRGVYHVVRRGETIYSIARRFGTTAYRIAVCNGLASYTVYVGQTLLVPTARS